MSKYEAFVKSGALAGANQTYLEEMYYQYLDDPSSVPTKWSKFFEQNGDISEQLENQHLIKIDHLKRLDYSAKTMTSAGGSQMPEFYRRYGHLNAAQDRLSKEYKPTFSDLHGAQQFTDNVEVKTSSGTQSLSPEQAAQFYSEKYCSSMGYEFMHCEDLEIRNWWIEQIEQVSHEPSPEILIEVWKDLVRSSELERFLGIQFVGQKRFSVEGGESLIPVLNRIIEVQSEHGVRDQVIGMAHRGRLNVLINILGMPVQALVDEFRGANRMDETTGDVKYHLGYSIDRDIAGDKTHLSLCYNPSHLEAVNSVVMGNVRARNDRHVSEPLLQKTKAAGILIHGDASIAGQGSVIETLNMSKTVHVVVNNQVGFTTDPVDDRTGRYCTDVAKSINAPVIHVDGDDPKACYIAAQLAAKFRQRFGKDVFIDLICFRRHGHNEADEPRTTQPVFYKTIRQHPGVAKQYGDYLLKAGILDSDNQKAFIDQVRSQLSKGEKLVSYATNSHTLRHTEWAKMRDDAPDVDTGVDMADLKKAASKAFAIPEMNIQKQVHSVLKSRELMINGAPFNWGFGELMAYATLLEEGFQVRLVGQDSQRGTFSHRLSVLHDQESGQAICPLKQAYGDDQFHVYNSTLSEYAALGYEYGYSETNANTLTIWEAQFGDFVNGAQIIIDQFISSGFQKWKRRCGLVMLLPHGYEGQGPEHSSARLERFLQLCAQNNMHVAVPSTPAQIFHLLRLQMHRENRLPLIVMSPKSLLRNPKAVSSLEDIATGRFMPVLDDPNPVLDAEKVVLCSGKVFYDLQEMRDEHQLPIALVRIERLYPFPNDEVASVLSQYKQAKEIVWCQEEPFNQGAWLSIRHQIEKVTGANQHLRYSGRDEQASPAVGYASRHQFVQKHIIAKTLGIQTKE